jgi:hypothetical protein
LRIRLQWRFPLDEVRADAMPAADKSPVIIELERQILRRLCAPQTDLQADAQTRSEARQRAMGELRKHTWMDAEHRVVFDALARLPGREAMELQRQLPAQATRMGFPDVDWEPYFASCASHGALSMEIAPENLATLIAKLRAASGEPAS